MQRVILNSEANKLCCIDGFIEENERKGKATKGDSSHDIPIRGSPPSQSERIASTHLVPAGKRGQHYYTSKLSAGLIFWT